MNPFFFDLLIVAIVVISSLWGRKRGFILTLCGFLAVFVALIGAAVLTNLFAPPLSRLAVPFVETHLETLVGSSVGSIYADAEGTIHATFDQVLALMDRSELLSGLKSAILRAVENGALDATGDAVREVVSYVAEQLTRLILFPIFFLLLLLAWTVASHLLDLAFHLPGLNFLNRLSGLVLGFARGVLLVFILCWLLRDSFLTPDMVDGSFLLPYFCGGNPLLDISIINS